MPPCRYGSASILRCSLQPGHILRDWLPFGLDGDHVPGDSEEQLDRVVGQAGAIPSGAVADTMGSMVELRVDHARLREVCERYGIVRLDVFGSVSRGDADPDSDVDLLYSPAPATRLGWAIEDLTNDLAEVFGRPVDLVSRRAIHQRIRDRVLADAQTLYAA